MRHFDPIIVFKSLNVDNRIRKTENGNVDANQSIRFQSYESAYIWKRISVNGASFWSKWRDV